MEYAAASGGTDAHYAVVAGSVNAGFHALGWRWQQSVLHSANAGTCKTNTVQMVAP